MKEAKRGWNQSRVLWWDHKNNSPFFCIALNSTHYLFKHKEWNAHAVGVQGVKKCSFNRTLGNTPVVSGLDSKVVAVSVPPQM
jgi:hypothetical protein